MIWYEELDFDEDPFSTDPRDYNNSFVKMDELIDEVVYRINAGSMLVIEGSKGTAKTSLLMYAAKKFGGKRNVVYVDCNILDKELNVTHVLQDKYGMLGRLLNKKPKEMIVLLDNANALSKKNTERMKYYFDQNYIKSVIFTCTSYKKAKFSDSLRDRIGNRVIKTPKISPDDAVDIIRNRIGDEELLNDKLIKKIFKLSKNSVKLLLENCTKLAESAVSKNRKRIQLADFRVLMGDRENDMV